jgi:DNA-binding NtrC family response regulator
VTEVSSGEQALEMLGDRSFDVAILDVVLGGRVDGFRVLEVIRKRCPGTATIMLTAHASLESAVHALRDGVDGYLLKPVRAAELRQAVQEALEKRSRPRDGHKIPPETQFCPVENGQVRCRTQ